MTRGPGDARLSRVRACWARLRGTVAPHHAEDRLDVEIGHHLDQLTQEFIARGLSAADARDAARRAFGNVDRVRMIHRETRGFPGIDGVVQDVRFAGRLLRRDRGYALTAILVLGLGIGVNNMMFTLIYGSTMRGLAIDRADRVLHISTFDQRFPDRLLSYPELEDLRAHTRTFSGLGAFANAPVSVGDDGASPDRFDGTYVTASSFGVLGIRPALGRDFTSTDDQPGAARVVILGDRAWRLRYAGDPAIIGRSILVDGEPATVIGVMPEPPRFPSTAQVWLPLAALPLDRASRDARSLRVFGRVRDDVSIAAARAEVEAVIARIAQQFPESSQGLQGRVVPINERFFGTPWQSAWLAFSTAGVLILLVSCANAANLMLSRTGLRAREIALRSSLGASRLRLATQLLVESALIAAVSGIVALGVSMAAVRLFRAGIPDGAMPHWLNYSMDGRVLLALVLASFGAVLLFGLVPSIRASGADANRVLKDGGRSSVPVPRRLTTAFLVAEFALTVVLLSPLVESLNDDRFGVPSDRVLHTTAVVTAALTLPAARYRTAEQRRDFYDRLFTELEGTAGLSAASAVTVLPLTIAPERRLDLEDAPRVSTEAAPAVATVSIAPRYFDVLALGVVRGRDFAGPDGLPGQEAAIVNQRFVEVHLAGGEPLGRRIRLTAPNAPASAAVPFTIVGIVDNVRQLTTSGAQPVVYVPLRGDPPLSAVVLVRSALDPSTATQSLRQALLALDPGLPLYRVMTLAQAIDDAQWTGRASSRLITGLTLLALFVCTIGLYAVTSHAVSQRTHEIGLRMALGARAWDVQRLVLRRAAVQVGVGLVVGLAGSVVWASVFPSERPDMPLLRPAVLGWICLVLTAVAVIACLVPIRRAVSLSPVEALRQE